MPRGSYHARPPQANEVAAAICYGGTTDQAENKTGGLFAWVHVTRFNIWLMEDWETWPHAEERSSDHFFSTD
jgi:hypothetical protein